MDSAGALAPRVGCDLAAVDAVREAIAAFGERYLARVYSADERRQTREEPARLAARFAGKEAVLKLLGVDGLNVRQVEIISVASGSPSVRLAPAARASAAAQGIGEIAVSLSHEDGMAMATAFALATGPVAGSVTAAPNKSDNSGGLSD